MINQTFTWGLLSSELSESLLQRLLTFLFNAKPHGKLRYQQQRLVKDKYKPKNGHEAVDTINCSNCQASYIGEIGKNVNTRLTDHRWTARNGVVSDHIHELHRLSNRTIDWDSARYWPTAYLFLTTKTMYPQRQKLDCFLCVQYEI